MGASSSIIGASPFHIHISLSSKYIDEDKLIPKIVNKLQESGIHVTVTNAHHTVKTICETLKQANMVIYCTTQNYGSCVTQATEYSYLSENDKPVYNMIIDRYSNHLFTEHVQELLNGKGWEMSSVQDIPSIIENINKQMISSY